MAIGFGALMWLAVGLGRWLWPAADRVGLCVSGQLSGAQLARRKREQRSRSRGVLTSTVSSRNRMLPRKAPQAASHRSLVPKNTNKGTFRSAKEPLLLIDVNIGRGQVRVDDLAAHDLVLVC